MFYFYCGKRFQGSQRILYPQKMLSSVGSEMLGLNPTVCFNLWLEDLSNISNDALNTLSHKSLNVFISIVAGRITPIEGNTPYLLEKNYTVQ